MPIANEHAKPARSTDDTAQPRGETYDAQLDLRRLGRQLQGVRDYMFMASEYGWRTLQEIAGATGYPEASVSARLRDLRRPVYGALVVERRRRGEGARGLHEYRIKLPRPAEEA